MNSCMPVCTCTSYFEWPPVAAWNHSQGHRAGACQPGSACCCPTSLPTLPPAVAANASQRVALDWGGQSGVLEVSTGTTLAFQRVVSQHPAPCEFVRYSSQGWERGWHLLGSCMQSGSVQFAVLQLARVMPLTSSPHPASLRLSRFSTTTDVSGSPKLPVEVKGSFLWPTVSGLDGHNVRPAGCSTDKVLHTWVHAAY